MYMMKEPSPGGRCYARMSGTMACLLPTFAILSLTTGWTQSASVCPNLDTAMLGIDPITTNVIEQPDQGMKGKIFEALNEESYLGNEVINEFVQVIPANKCTTDISIEVIRTFDDYRCLVSSPNTFATEEDSVTTLGSPELSFKDNGGYGSLNEPRVAFIRDFLNQTGGDLILAKSVCITHTVNIVPLEQPIFSQAFMKAVVKLHKATQYTVDEDRKALFHQFYRYYGTHFARTTDMGSEAIFGMMFPSRAASAVEEAARRQCVNESAYESLTSTVRWINESVSLHFARVVAEKCEREMPQTFVTLLGPVPDSSFEGWNSVAKESPRPVRRTIEKIGNLFTEDEEFTSMGIWYTKIDLERLSQYFEKYLSSFSRPVVDRALQSLSGPCAYKSFIPEIKTGSQDVDSTGTSTTPSKTAPSSTTPSSNASSSTPLSQTAPSLTTPSSTASSATTAPSQTAPSQTATSPTTPWSTAFSPTAPPSTAPSRTATSQMAPSPTTPSSSSPSSTSISPTASSPTAPSSTTPATMTPATMTPATTIPATTTPAKRTTTTTTTPATTTGRIQSASVCPNLDTAMLGIDPITSNFIEQPDQGMKGRIFEAMEEQGDAYCLPAKFVQVIPANKCTTHISVEVIRTFDDYRCFVSSSNSFATEEDSVTTLGSPGLSFKDNGGYGSLNKPRTASIRDFLNQTGGELILAKSLCITHTVNIIPFEQPIFSRVFMRALVKLNEATQYTVDENRKSLFHQFYRYYGSHFARTTDMGSEAIFGMMFPSRAASKGEEAARRQCVKESAYESLTPTARWINESVSLQFARLVTEKCGREMPQTFVTIVGPAPDSNFEDWDSAAKVSPRPVRRTIEKTGNLFRDHIKFIAPGFAYWKFDRERLSHYFQEYLPSFSRPGVDRALQSLPGPCADKFFIPPINTESHDVDSTETGTTSSPTAHSSTTPAPTTLATTTPTTTTPAPWILPGGIIIVGGFRSFTPTLALFTPAPPPFPHDAFDNTLSLVDSVLHSCGGYHWRDECLTLDTRTQDTWQSYDIPWQIYGHSAVVVNEDIWLFHSTNLMIIRTQNRANKFDTISLGFDPGLDCDAVTQGSKTFVIGAGSGNNEVWVNTDHRIPEQWKIFARLRVGRQYFGCVVLDGDIFVTGGRDATYIRLSSVEVISIATGAVRTISPLGEVRYSHQMAIIHGRPAVLGGWNRITRVASIEAYNNQRGSWESLNTSLDEPRGNFGLAQYLP